MYMNNFILSIIMPTKNRQKYCISSLEQITRVIDNSSLNIEVLIKDNSDTNILEDEINNLKKTYISYYYESGIVSFVDNFDDAVKKSKGKYLLIIGDDDGVLPYLIDVILLMEKNNIDAIIPDLGAVYFWPSSKDIVKNSRNGLLVLSKKPVKCKIVDTNKGLKNLINKAGQDYQNLNLARIYHGIVKKDILVLNKDFKYFGGLTPDIYSSVILSINSRKTVRISLPITISGICEKSGSSDSATGKHTGNLKDAPHFRGHSNYVWYKEIPAIYTVETIWAETVIKALIDSSAYELLNNFNFNKLNEILLKKYPLLMGKNHLLKKDENNFYIFIKKCFNFINKVMIRIKRRNLVYKYYNIVDIQTAEYIINTKVNNKVIKKLLKRMENLK